MILNQNATDGSDSLFVAIKKFKFFKSHRLSKISF